MSVWVEVVDSFTRSSILPVMKKSMVILGSSLALLALGLVLPGAALAKYRCADFQTCEQAMKALKAGATYLDKDGDGVPCEALCR